MTYPMPALHGLRWSNVYLLNGEIESAPERNLSMATAPAPPQVGVPVDKASLNAKLGGATSSLRKAAVALAELNEWAAAYDAQQLADLYGFTLDEANLFKSAMGEVPAVTGVVDGLQWLSKTWGS